MKTIDTPISIPKRITKGKELVVLTKDEYNRLVETKKETLQILQIIAEGEKAYREGKTIVASSLKQALKFNAK
ncbi:MAG: hypothetical protein AABY84_12185 [Candidatus Firestonebacteria bacterium]